MHRSIRCTYTWLLHEPCAPWQAHANELPLLYFAPWLRLRDLLERELGKQASGREKLEALRMAVGWGMPTWSKCATW